MSLASFFNRFVRRPPRSRVIYHGLIDSADNTLIALGIHAPALVLLNESLMDSIYVPRMGSRDALASVISQGPGTYPEWSWNFRTRTFGRTSAALVTEEMRDRARIAAKKNEVLSYCMYWINRSRDKIHSGFLLQETIYAEKERQAQFFKDSGFDERHAKSAPYVAHYAADVHMSLRQAAEEILLQAQLDREYLEKSERTRLEIFRTIRRAKTRAELDTILKEFWKSGVI